jgi:hypothetical protein
MVCLRNICINTLHKGDNIDDADDDDNNNNKTFLTTHTDTSTLDHWDVIMIEVGE